MARKVERGEFTGMAPFGKRVSGDGVTLEEHPEEVATLETMLRWRSEGMSFRKIAQRLDDEGHAPRGERWHCTTVVRMIKRHSE